MESTVKLKTSNVLSLRAYKALHFFVSVLVFFMFWIRFRYGKITEIVITRAFRYDLYVALLYALLLFCFVRTYNTYLLGYLRIRQLVMSQFISQLFSGAIVLLLVFTAWMHYKPIGVFIYMLVIYAGIDCLWACSANYLFYEYNPRKRAIVLYGSENGRCFDMDITGKPIERLISIEKECFCSENNLHEIISELDCYDVFFAGGLSSVCVNVLAQLCIEKNKEGFFLPNVGEIIFQNAYHIQSFHEPVLAVSKKRINPEYLFMKRAFDIFASLIGIIVLSPLMIISAAAIKLYDGGPAVYKQIRLTKDGKEFTLYKFRSMCVDAEKDGRAVLSSGNSDNRITPIGKVIRAIRFDELPQLFNILKGDMTIVGPRPERPEIAEQYYETLPEFKLRLQVKAGLTGYAQVYGKYNTSPEQKLKFDLMYINRMSVFTDIRLMFATFGILFSKESTEGVKGKKDITIGL